MSKVVDVVVDSTMVVDNQKTIGIGARMKAAREALSLTQDSLAKAVGASKRGIQDNEAQKSVPGGDVIAGMVGLGINANWLLTNEGPMLLADLVAPAAPRSPMINVGALETIIEGALRVAPKAPADKLACLCASMYQQVIEQGLITPEGEGTGNLSNAA